MLEFKDGILVKCPLPFVISLIPVSNKTSRPQSELTATSITVHNPGNSGTAKNQSDYIDEAYDRYASWHFTIGKDTIYQELPINEMAWHAGDGTNGKGNTTSIGIEIEETDEAEELAIIFIKLLMEKLNINIVVPHQVWSGKYCPRIILPHWDEFIAKVKGEEMTYTEIQSALKELGYYTGSIDGSFGPASIQAVKDFQLSRGLTVDGSPGPATQSEILKAVDEMETPSLTLEEEVSILKQKVAAIEKKL